MATSSCALLPRWSKTAPSNRVGELRGCRGRGIGDRAVEPLFAKFVAVSARLGHAAGDKHEMIVFAQQHRCIRALMHLERPDEVALADNLFD